MRRYSGNGTAAAGATLTIGEVVNLGATTRARIYDIIIGSDAAPADIATRFTVIRGTVSGTAASTFTPTALDSADPASLMSFKVGTFTGQTKTANSGMLFIDLNQRATFRWVAVPDSELIMPTTSDNWIGLESVSSGATPAIGTTFLWLE